MKGEPKESASPGIEEGSLGPEWMDVLENGQLLKKVLRPGDTSSARPERGYRVTINLKTRIRETGAEVSSETFEKIEVFLGDYDLIHGVDLALALMHRGETSMVVIHPRFGYGEEGKAPDVPPNATLECEVHLLSYVWVDTDSTLPLNERISIGLRKKDRGNFWFGRREYNSAIHCYRRAVDFLDATEDEMHEYHSILASNSNSLTSSPSTSSLTRRKDKINIDSNLEKERQRQRIFQLIDLRATAFNNLANAQMQTEGFDQALKSVNSSLQLNEQNVKAWYRKGKILLSTGELVEAIEAVKMALKLEPESRTIQSFLNELVKKRREELANEKKLYRIMLQVDPSSVPSSSLKGRQHGGKWYSCLLSASPAKMGLVGGACSLIVVLSGILVYYFL